MLRAVSLSGFGCLCGDSKAGKPRIGVLLLKMASIDRASARATRAGGSGSSDSAGEMDATPPDTSISPGVMRQLRFRDALQRSQAGTFDR